MSGIAKNQSTHEATMHAGGRLTERPEGAESCLVARGSSHRAIYLHRRFCSFVWRTSSITSPVPSEHMFTVDFPPSFVVGTFVCAPFFGLLIFTFLDWTS